MGRRISSEKNNHVFVHPVVSFSFLVAWIAATIIITAALCGTRSRKAKLSPKAASSSSTQEEGESKTEPTTIMVSEPIAREKENSTEREIQEQQLQPPPITKWKEYSSHKFQTLSSASKRKLSSTLSMKLPRAMSMRCRDGKDEPQKQKQKQFKPEDSIWMKTIMLGEKCRVPMEEDAIIYDEKGNRLTSYPSRIPRSLPVSRSNSFVQGDAFPSFEEYKFSRIEATSTANQEH